MWQTTAKEVYLSMISDLVSLQFDYATKSFEENFETLSNLVKKTKKNSLVLAPELCLSGYKYDNLDESANFSEKILPKIKELSKDRILSLTLTQKKDDKFYNNAKVFYDGEEIYSRAKAKLFSLGDEQNHFQSGEIRDISIINIQGVKIAILICFELRFTELWDKVKGADIILLPSYWGKPRKSHLKALSVALAIANQCFVVTSNSSDDNMASSSCIVDPFGVISEDDNLNITTMPYEKKTIKKMRRYIDIGLQ